MDKNLKTPCIAIIRHQAGKYGWAVFYKDEKLGDDMPEASIEACLTGALGSLPDDAELVEIRYRGMHMGTFDKGYIEDDTDEIAISISEKYDYLMHN